MNIEMARFGERLKVTYNIPDYLDFNLPCLILQPLVENAIKHGVLPRENGGTVEIGAAPHGRNVRLYVYDNGVGIPGKSCPICWKSSLPPYGKKITDPSGNP